MIEIAPDKFDESIFRLLGKDWALITSGDIENFNMMTASWGGAGVLWAKPVATIYVRPERYTHPAIHSLILSLTTATGSCRNGL